ncbi:hypothetical protein WJX73_003800 [Symbiochloris irregularis]|uniref:N-acetyltransferase domain-containing protein n=1 Tax=Symbiochloris irregularis TaxID=706552 RepID=A0AAW1NIQ3_9CHLO
MPLALSSRHVHICTTSQPPSVFDLRLAFHASSTCSRPGGWRAPHGRCLHVACTAPQGQSVRQEPLEEPPPPRRKFRAFTQQSPLRQSLLDFRQRSHTPRGTLVIQPLTQEWLQGTADLLSVSFGESLGYIPAYRHFLKRHISKYLSDHMELVPKALILIALLLPESLSRGTWDSADSEVDQSSEWGSLVGSVEISMSPSTRARFLTLNPPEDKAYLSNMAVAQHHRRRGYGRKLLEAAESACALSGHRDLFLHLRFQDQAASVLYRDAGYEEESWVPSRGNACFGLYWYLVIVGMFCIVKLKRRAEVCVRKSKFCERGYHVCVP